MKRINRILVLSGLVLGLSVGLRAEDADPTPGGPPATPPGKERRHMVNENASENAKAVQGLLKTFDARRDQLMAQRRELLQKLEGAATEAEKKEIIDQLRAEQKLRQEEQRTLRREIGEELKRLREQRKSGGGS
jgi:hypothetical protein